jgi:hypothetical protein
VERNLRELRRVVVGRRMSQTKPGGLLRREVPVVVGRWRELDTPGYLEIDLVSHSGEVAAGEWTWTLCATDLSAGWTERVPVMGKGQTRIVAALERIERQLPFPLLGLHPRQRQRVPQLASAALVSPDRDPALPLSPRAQERQLPRGAEELDPGAPPDRLPAARHPGPAAVSTPSTATSFALTTTASIR